MSSSSDEQEQYDVIVVGARCAGSATATVLARAGRRVLLLDRDEFPSDTVSTHQLFPDSLHLLDELGAGELLRARHELRPVEYSWRVLGHAVAGGFSPIGGHDRTMSIRRVTLDAALLESATKAGAEARLGAAVEDVIGAGTPEDPVRGVVLATGERVLAPWVIGADGRRSTVARRLALPTTDHRRGEMAMLFAYWEGLPASGWCHIDVHGRLGVMSTPCEDGLHLLSVAGPPELTRGSAAEREEAYLASLQRFPAVLNPRLLQQARQTSPVVVVPETMLRGFTRPASGAGWALVGDSGMFKHPVTAQGIGDALAHGWHVGTALARGDALDGYDAWRTERSAGHFEWSFQAARFPGADAAALYAGLAADPVAGREFLDSFAKRYEPAAVLTPARRARWRAAWVYEDGLNELQVILEGLDPDALETVVPACPDWTVSDLLAHLAGLAQDTVLSGYFAGALDAWHTPELAAARDAWTAGHLERQVDRSRDALLGQLQQHGTALVSSLRRGDGALGGGPAWMAPAPAADLAVHLEDLREAVGEPPANSSAVARHGFGAYRDWLHQRLVECRLPAIELTDGRRSWVVGEGVPVGSVTASVYELFRTITGRRSADQIIGLPWTTDPRPYLTVISPYPLPG